MYEANNSPPSFAKVKKKLEVLEVYFQFPVRHCRCGALFSAGHFRFSFIFNESQKSGWPPC